jgi:hypothetical protein
MWASVAGVFAPEKREFSEDETATADRVCEACALWDGSVEALRGMRFGDDWRVTMAVISQGEQCWDDVMRVCDAIVRNEGFFISAYMGKGGHIYTPEMIVHYQGRVDPGVSLTFPDPEGMYREDESAGHGDPWDGIYDRRSAWSR